MPLLYPTLMFITEIKNYVEISRKIYENGWTSLLMISIKFV